MGRRCVCGDIRRAHDHDRPGTDCGWGDCGCMGFRWRWLHLRQWRTSAWVRYHLIPLAARTSRQRGL